MSRWFRELAPAGDDFWDYFDIADELWDLGDGSGLTMQDLDEEIVTRAKIYAHREELPWPPHLPTAEEALNDMNRYEHSKAGNRT